ncbi:MAG: acyl-CoA dehydrogenase, partial [Paenibacillus sp.]|nr:acyl-CoA dehydrogenase [Paenibacillus sp.]
MQFHLSDEQEMTREVIRGFAESTVSPSAMDRDERERFDREIFEKMREMGLT